MNPNNYGEQRVQARATFDGMHPTPRERQVLGGYLTRVDKVLRILLEDPDLGTLESGCLHRYCPLPDSPDAAIHAMTAEECNDVGANMQGCLAPDEHHPYVERDRLARLNAALAALGIPALHE